MINGFRGIYDRIDKSKYQDEALRLCRILKENPGNILKEDDKYVSEMLFDEESKEHFNKVMKLFFLMNPRWLNVYNQIENEKGAFGCVVEINSSSDTEKSKQWNLEKEILDYIPDMSDDNLQMTALTMYVLNKIAHNLKNISQNLVREILIKNDVSQEELTENSDLIEDIINSIVIEKRFNKKYLYIINELKEKYNIEYDSLRNQLNKFGFEELINFKEKAYFLKDSEQKKVANILRNRVGTRDEVDYGKKIDEDGKRLVFIMDIPFLGQVCTHIKSLGNELTKELPIYENDLYNRKSSMIIPKDNIMPNDKINELILGLKQKLKTKTKECIAKKENIYDNFEIKILINRIKNIIICYTGGTKVDVKNMEDEIDNMIFAMIDEIEI